MYKYKRTLVVVLAAAIIMALAACGVSAPPADQTTQTDSAETTTQGETQAETETPPEGGGWDTPFAETVQVRVGLPEIVNARFAEGEDMTDNLWTRHFKERFNVEIIVDWVSTEYETKLNLAIASRDLPDAFHSNIVQLNQMMDAGMLEDLTDVYNNYASPSYRRMIEPNWDIVETGMRDGKIYAMPRLHYGYETSTMFLWARKDWVEANNITSVNTIEDFENMMRAFMENNGAQFGTMLDRTLNMFFQMAPAFHAYPTIWVDGPDGSIVHGATLPQTREALAKWAEWYREGFVKQDFAMMDNAAMLRDAYNGLVGTYAQQNWAGWQVGKDMVDNQGEDSYFISFNLPSVDGRELKYPIVFPNNVYNVIRKGYEHPEVLIKLINAYIDVLDDSIANGTMTLEEVLPFNTNDMHHITGPFKVEFNHYNDIIEVSTAVRTGEQKFSTGNATLFYNEIMRWVNDGDLTGMGRWLQMGRETSSLVLAIDHVDNNQIHKSRLWGKMPQALLDYGSTLNDLLIEGYTKIIMGVEDISYYDTLIESWRRAGGDEVTAAVNEMYGN